MVKKLHEANSAMQIMERKIKEIQESEDLKVQDITFYKNKNVELMTEVQFQNDKLLKEKDQYDDLKKEYDVKFQNQLKKEKKLKNLAYKLESELKNNFKTCFDMNNFLN